MPINASCCGEWITVSEEGAGFWRDFDCASFMGDKRPETEAARRSIAQQLFNKDKLCPEIAPYCEEWKDDLQRERSRWRDVESRRKNDKAPESDTDPLIPEWIHDALDIAGLFPALGVIPDAANAGLYLIEGDFINAGISAIAMVEGIGQGATLARQGVKISGKAARDLGWEGMAKAFRNAKNLDTELNSIVKSTQDIVKIRKIASKMNNARAGSLFERWVNHYVFHSPVGQPSKRLRVPIDLNSEHLDSVTGTRTSDFYLDNAGTLWDSKIYRSASEVDAQQLGDYNAFVEQGWVWIDVGVKADVKDIGYIFSDVAAARNNLKLIQQGGGEVYYIDDLGKLVHLDRL